MSSAKKLYGAFQRSDGRIKLMTLLGVSGVVAILAMFMVIPALAGPGLPSKSNIQPAEVSYGGGSGACAVYSDAPYELHINNPVDGTFKGPDGTTVSIDVSPNATNTGSNTRDMYFDFVFTNHPSMYVSDIVVNGGAKNTHYDYAAGVTGPVRSDQSLHAPTKGNSNNLYLLSHINICYGELPVADLGVTKKPVPEADPFVVDVGEQVTFEILVTNAGPLNATGVDVTDELPIGMGFVSASDGGTYHSEDGTVTWSNLSITSGQSKTLTLVVLIGEDAAGQEVFNSVSVEGDQDDTNDTNNTNESDPPVTVTADLSGAKYHDRDTDGALDTDGNEEPLAGWVFTAFQWDNSENEWVEVASSQPTQADGTYTIPNLTPGAYVVCEQSTDTGLAGLVGGDLGDLESDGFRWSWTPSQPANEVCAGIEGYESAGYSIDEDDFEAIGDDEDNDGIVGVDFGNHIQVTINCTDDDVVLSLGEDEDPTATIVIPQGTPSCSDGAPPYTATFDVGTSLDSDDWRQFVVWGGPNTEDGRTFQLTAEWLEEEADYRDGSGEECDPEVVVECGLFVPTTLVTLLPGASPTLANITFCNDVEPTLADPVCLDYRDIAEGGDVTAGYIQVTDHIWLYGDPGFFR